jgi:hypothetical protein
MPSATTHGGLGFLNNGPLTTTFTAPASCSTAGFVTDIAYASDPSDWFVGADCTSTQPVDCTPPGPVITSLAAAWAAGNPAADQLVPYYSPGLVCPAGWTTAGAATKVNPTSTTISGAAFNVNVSAIDTGGPFFFDPWTDAFLSLLDPSETAVACCPRFALLRLTTSMSGARPEANTLRLVLSPGPRLTAILPSRRQSSRPVLGARVTYPTALSQR